MKPSEALALKRDLLPSVVARYCSENLRVFGAALEGKDREDSELELLVDPLPEATLFELGGLQVELENLLGVTVHLWTPLDLPLSFRSEVLAEARPI